MTNDSKLGLLAGVVAVVLIAVVYYQNGSPGVAATPVQAKPAAVTLPAVASTPADSVRR